MTRLTTALALGVLATGFIACSSDDNSDVTSPDMTASVRITDAAPGTSDVAAFNGSTSLATGLSYQGSSASCATVPAGSQTLTFKSGGSSLASTSAYDFQAGGKYTVVLYGSGANTQAVVVPDTGAMTATTGNNAVRFFNATGSTSDLFFTEPSATLGTPTASALASGMATSNFVNYPTTVTNAQLFAPGTTTNPTVTYTVPTITGNVGTVVFTGTQGGSATPGAYVVTPCP